VTQPVRSCHLHQSSRLPLPPTGTVSQNWFPASISARISVMNGVLLQSGMKNTIMGYLPQSSDDSTELITNRHSEFWRPVAM
jgi:hypothetical protein